MNVIQAGQAALIARMKSSAGVEVRYTRGDNAIDITAWIGRTAFKRVQNDKGAAVIWGERDYFIAAADLIIGGSRVTPAKGDQVTETIDGQEVTFELMALSGEDTWRYSDQTRTVIRLHVKRV